jgi:predicted nuclease with TOPRIM domain
MSVNFSALGGLFTFRYINDVEDMDLDDLQEVYADLEDEYNESNKECEELKSELDKLKEVIESKNPEEKREKLKRIDVRTELRRINR